MHNMENMTGENVDKCIIYYLSSDVGIGVIILETDDRMYTNRQVIALLKIVTNNKCLGEKYVISKAAGDIIDVDSLLFNIASQSVNCAISTELNNEHRIYVKRLFPTKIAEAEEYMITNDCWGLAYVCLEHRDFFNFILHNVKNSEVHNSLLTIQSFVRGIEKEQLT